MANTTTTMTIHWKNGVSIIHAGTPLDTNGYPVMDDTAVGIVAEDVQMPDKTATVITAGEWDEIVNEAYFHIADAVKLKLSDITFTPPPASGGSGDPGVFAFDVTIDADTGALVMGATWQELKDAFDDQKPCCGFFDAPGELYQKTAFHVFGVAQSGESAFVVICLVNDGSVVFGTDSADGNPTYTEQSNGGEIDDLQIVTNP